MCVLHAFPIFLLVDVIDGEKVGWGEIRHQRPFLATLGADYGACPGRLCQKNKKTNEQWLTNVGKIKRTNEQWRLIVCGCEKEVER